MQLRKSNESNLLEFTTCVCICKNSGWKCCSNCYLTWKCPFSFGSRASIMRRACTSALPSFTRGKYHCKHSESASKTRRTQNIHTMSTRALSLPIRALSRPQIVQHAERYTCRRCLHGTQAQAQEATSAPIDAPAHLRPAPLGLLKRNLPHSIRPQLLQHVDPERLNGREKEGALNARKHADIVGVVVRTGRMDKTVSVRVPKQRWEPRIKKV
jgi:hypothetical protein